MRRDIACMDKLCIHCGCGLSGIHDDSAGPKPLLLDLFSGAAGAAVLICPPHAPAVRPGRGRTGGCLPPGGRPRCVPRRQGAGDGLGLGFMMGRYSFWNNRTNSLVNC